MAKCNQLKPLPFKGLMIIISIFQITCMLKISIEKSQDNCNWRQTTYIEQRIPVTTQAMQQSKQCKNIQRRILDSDMSWQRCSDESF